MKRDAAREERLRRARYWERHERIKMIKRIAGAIAIVVVMLAASAVVLYAAVRLIRAAWGAS